MGLPAVSGFHTKSPAFFAGFFALCARNVARLFFARERIMKKLFVIFWALIFSGCAPKLSPLEMAQRLNENPEFKSIVRVINVYVDVAYYGCAAASIGEGLFLTSAGCILPYDIWVRGLDGQRHKAKLVKAGKNVDSASNVVNDTAENYAILYAPTLMLPPLSLAGARMKKGEEYCLFYFESNAASSIGYSFKSLTPIKICGDVGSKSGHHRPIFWKGGEGMTIGYQGGPVLNSDGEIVGLLSYTYGKRAQRGGVLSLRGFAAGVKEVRAIPSYAL